MSDIYSDAYRAGDGAPAISARLARFAGAAVFLLLILGMAVWAYRLGTRDAAEVPIIRAMEEPARVQPADPGGLTAAHQGLEVNSVLAAVPTPTPTSETAARLSPPTVTLAEEDGPQGELVLAAPEFAPVAAPEVAGELRMPIGEDDIDAVARLDGDDRPNAPPTAERSPGEPVTFGAAPAEAASVSVSASASDDGVDAPAAGADTDIGALIASLEPSDEAAADAADAATTGPRPRVRPAGLVVRASAPAPAAAPAPQQVAALAPPAASAAAAPREVTSLNSGTRLVQLGAFDSEAMARQTWSQILVRNGDLLGSKSLFLERATHNARVFYRLRVAGFQSADQTRIMCESLRARGVDCIPVTLN
jgi:hypothetical protein